MSTAYDSWVYEQQEPGDKLRGHRKQPQQPSNRFAPSTCGVPLDVHIENMKHEGLTDEEKTQQQLDHLKKLGL